MGSDPQYIKFPQLSLAQHIFQLTNPHSSKEISQDSITALQNAISEHEMAPLYRYLAHPTEGCLNVAGEGGSKISSRSSGKPPRGPAQSLSTAVAPQIEFPWDQKLFEKLQAANAEELKVIEKEEAEAVEKAGETEIQAAKGKQAEFWSRIGERELALSSYESLLESSSVLGTKIDVVLAMIRIGIFFNDRMMVKKHIERAKALVDSGGDWDRRNRLKAYQGLHYLTIRAYDLAAGLLLDSLSTFTSYELCGYSTLITYSILAGAVSLKRIDFKKKVVDAPEIKAIVGNSDEKISALTGTISAGQGADDTDETMEDGSSATPQANSTAFNLTAVEHSLTEHAEEKPVDFSPLSRLVNSLYEGNYRMFFLALAATEDNFLSQDRYLYEHRGWFVREMRLRGYQQLLQSYRVVGLKNMADDFGVTVDFLDRDLAKFIAGERIPCTIDRVKGTIETNRPDDKNKQYNDVVRQGDALITKLQKYGQAVRLRGSERG